MELSDLILNDHSEDWKINNNTIFCKKLLYLPVCYVEDGVFYIYLDKRIINQVKKMIKKLMKTDLEFYLTTPRYANPREEIDNNEVIKSYLYVLLDKKFLAFIEKINFDLLENLILWLNKEDCNELFIDNFNTINKLANESWYDFYTQTKAYAYDISTREYFSTLLRDFQINRLLL
jgi:hypothetical protein